MTDRRFTMMLALVVAAGLVMGLIAFRVTGSSAGNAARIAATASNDGQPHPSAADAEVASSDQPTDAAPLSGEAEATNGEPTTPSKVPPEMQGPINADPPGTAAQAPAAAQAQAQAQAPQEAPAQPASPSLDATPL